MPAHRLLRPGSRLLGAAVLAACSLFSAQGLSAQDLVLKGVQITTGTGTPFAGDAAVDQLRVREGFLVEPGTAIADAQTIDLGGEGFVIPGLADAHAHLVGLGDSLVQVDVMGTESYEDVIARVVARAEKTPEGQWIVGRGWDQNDWPEKVFPLEAALSKAVPKHPVLLTRVDGHAALANRLAMDIAGIDASTPDPQGGRLIRDENGDPTGVLIDTAENLVAAVIPAPTDKQIEQSLLSAQQLCFRLGLTSVHNAGLSPRALEVMKRLHEDGEWHLRVHVMLPAASTQAIRQGVWDSGDDVIQVRGVKAYADGALGSRGAALLTPYTDEPGKRGLVLTPQAGLEKIAEMCVEYGFQLCVHAIGDRANRVVLDAFENVLPEDRREAARWRIEHAQVIHPDDFVRFRDLHVLPSMQPTHLTSDMPWAPDRLGEERILRTYAWKRFHELGVLTPFGSDFPVERPDPRLGLYSAITTKAVDGSGPAEGFRPDQKLDRLRALQGFTRDAAFAAFTEDRLGTIEVGKRGDFTVFDRDLMTCPADEILEAKVLLTVIGGRVVYDARPRPAKPVAIAQGRVAEVLGTLSSDDFAGRDTPSAELERAADQIADWFEAAKVGPGPGGRFHRYTLPGAQMPTMSSRFVIGENDVELKPGDDFRLFGAGRPFTLEAGTIEFGMPAGGAGRRRGMAGRSVVVLPVTANSPLWRAAEGERTVLSRRARGAAPLILLRADMLPNTAVSAKATIEVPAPKQVEIPLRNVVGFLPGTDMADEFVLVTAHYDHVGVRFGQGEDQIFNGTDDNATGTTAVVTLAEAFARQNIETRRSILFVCFSAEEKGLLGSRAFAEKPPVPLEKIAAVVNIEMLGRPEANREPYIWVTGASRSDFDERIAPVVAEVGVELSEFAMAERLFNASDNAPFARKGVVAHSISAGTLHEDYHGVDDEFEKVDLAHMTAVIQAIGAAVQEFANNDRPVWTEGK